MKFSDLQKKFNGDWNSVEGLNFEPYAPISKKYNYARQLLGIEKSPLIDVIDGVAVLNRMENEVGLYFYLCCLYTNIEFENSIISDKDYDFLAQNKFKDRLGKITGNDSFEASTLFKNIVLDEVRRLNSTPLQQFDKEEIDKVLNSLNDPKVERLLEFVGKEDIKNKAKELVKRDNSK